MQGHSRLSEGNNYWYNRKCCSSSKDNQFGWFKSELKLVEGQPIKITDIDGCLLHPESQGVFLKCYWLKSGNRSDLSLYRRPLFQFSSLFKIKTSHFLNTFYTTRWLSGGRPNDTFWFRDMLISHDSIQNYFVSNI